MQCNLWLEVYTCALKLFQVLVENFWQVICELSCLKNGKQVLNNKDPTQYVIVWINTHIECSDLCQIAALDLL